MIEIPEAALLAQQLNNTVRGKTITHVIAAQSPHKFAWYSGDPALYAQKLEHKTIEGARATAHFLEINARDERLVFCEGINLNYTEDLAKIPKKHQLLLELEDKSALWASVQMYGGLVCAAKDADQFEGGEYYQIAREKPFVLSDQFDPAYFTALISDNQVQKLSLKAFLATEQSIPGLGNGVLQDILFNARLHPRQKLNTLNDQQKQTLFQAIKTTLTEMTARGGRNTEKDLFGQPGGYVCQVCKNTLKQPCPVCQTLLEKGTYLGGSIYFCPQCQPLF